MVTIKVWFKRAVERVKKAIGWEREKCSVLDAMDWAHVVAVILLATCVVVLFITGCAKKVKPEAPKPAPVQTAPVPPDVPVDDQGFALNPDFKPDAVILRPGQTVMLLEDIEVEARIPYRGDELWTGRVKIERGSMVVKPMVEGE